MSTTTDRQRGYSLVEVVIVLVAGLLILAATAGVALKLNRDSDTKELISEIQQINGAMHQLFGPDGQYNTLGSSADLMSELKKQLPPEWRNAAPGTISGPRGIQIAVIPTAWSAGDPAGTAYLIAITQIPVASCVPLARAFAGMSDRVYAGQGFSMTKVFEAPDTPFDTAAAAAACPATGMAQISLINT